MIRSLPALALAVLLGACTHAEYKEAESQAFDVVASFVSAACRGCRDEGDTQCVKVPREVRQRGTDGPPPPDVIPEGLDPQTANGKGPVLILFCGPDSPPPPIWSRLIRDSRL